MPGEIKPYGRIPVIFRKFLAHDTRVLLVKTPTRAERVQLAREGHIYKKKMRVPIKKSTVVTCQKSVELFIVIEKKKD
jgi:hypothetical protein